MSLTLFHIPLNDLLTVGTLFSGLPFVLLLWFAKKDGQRSVRFLSLALGVSLLKVAGLPPGVFLALGPLFYFYTAQLTSSGRHFRGKDLLHFCPMLAAYWTPVWLVAPFILLYLLLSYRLIQQFYGRLQPLSMDRPRFAFRRQQYILVLLGALCVLMLVNAVFYLIIAWTLIATAAGILLRTELIALPAIGSTGEREKARRLKSVVANERLY